jgi:hypothetical protein
VRRVLAIVVSACLPAHAAADAAAPAGTQNFLGFPADAMTEPISTDRPDFTETPDAVPLGRVQIESGYTYTRTGDGGQDHTLPELLLRVGLLRDFELRIDWAGWSWGEDGGGWTASHNDVGVGFKVHLLDRDGAVPSLGFIGQVSVPVGEPPAGEDDFVPEGKLCWSYDLTDRVSLSGNANLAAAISEAGDRYAEPAASVSLGVALTERVGAYAEYFGSYPTGRGPPPAHSFNAGVTFLATNDLQFDARIGVGLNDHADDLFAGVGFAVRF